ncbi:hypothetical protein JXB02_03035 [Candidatus Woesearchaeota archaeon]|nr:hypothetical protein [Candidatus Woesearchaeota archaeon]
MAFSKRFPRSDDKTLYTRWEEVSLTPEEERAVEKEARERNHAVMKDCLEEAKAIVVESGLRPFQTNVVRIAVALFEKRASHEVFHKESRTKGKFDALQKKA